MKIGEALLENLQSKALGIMVSADFSQGMRGGVHLSWPSSIVRGQDRKVGVIGTFDLFRPEIAMKPNGVFVLIPDGRRSDKPNC